MYLAIVLIAISCISCEKQLDQSRIQKINVQNLDVEIIPNPFPIDQHIQGSGSSEDISFNKKLFQIAELIKPYFKNDDLNDYIISVASENLNQCIDLRNFDTWSCFDELQFSESQIRYTSLAINSIDLSRVTTNENGGAKERYIPALYVCNIENADAEKMPVLGVGVDVNELLPGMENCEDCIIVWYYDVANDEFVEGIMSEDMVKRCTNPVIIVDNAEEELTRNIEKKARYQTDKDGSKTSIPTSQFYLSSYEYKVNSRNEGTGKSELCVSGVIVDENNNFSTISFWYNNGKDYHQIAKIDQSEVGVQLYKWVPFVHPQDIVISDLIPLGNNYIFWNSFERDWARSRKTLGNPVINGVTYYLTGNMRYNSDWYAFNPLDIQSNGINLTYIYNNGSQLFSNSKGNIGIWKINN